MSKNTSTVTLSIKEYRNLIKELEHSAICHKAAMEEVERWQRMYSAEKVVTAALKMKNAELLEDYSHALNFIKSRKAKDSFTKFIESEGC